MRVKIEGEVSVERLFEAYQKACEAYGRVMPGFKLYGANLYLNAFNSDGIACELADNMGKPIVISLRLQKGDRLKPERTDEGEAFYNRRREEKMLIEREERAITERAEQENRAIRAKLKKEIEQYSLANKITERMLKTKPEFFLKKINEVVEKVWAQLEPREKSGAFKAMPIFTGGVDGLMIHVTTWKEPKRLSNPIYRLQYQRRVTLWTNEVWLEAVNGIQTLLDDFIKEELSEASLCQ